MPAPFPNDQYAAATVGSLDSNGILALMVRSSSSMFWGTGYIVFCFSNGTFQLGAVINGNLNSIQNFDTGAVNPGDQLMLSAQGTTISVWQNGTLVGSATDSSIAAGSPGMILYGGTAQSDCTVLEFQCGTLWGPVATPTTNQLGADVFTADRLGSLDATKWVPSTWPTDYPIVIVGLTNPPSQAVINQAAPSPASIGGIGVGYSAELFFLPGSVSAIGENLPQVTASGSVEY